MPSFSLFPSSHLLIYKKYPIHEKKNHKNARKINKYIITQSWHKDRSKDQQKIKSSVHKQQRVK